MFYVPKIKTETDMYGNFLDSTISISVLAISASNADFDKLTVASIGNYSRITPLTAGKP